MRRFQGSAIAASSRDAMLLVFINETGLQIIINKIGGSILSVK
jgi:hypothetical protein